jgi:hypothetical protein
VQLRRRTVAIVTTIMALAVVAEGSSITSSRLASIGGSLLTGLTDPQLFLGPQQDDAFAHGDSAAHPVLIETQDGGAWKVFARLRASSAGIFVATATHTWTSGFLRARADGQVSLPFSFVEPPDRFLHPFG